MTALLIIAIVIVSFAIVGNIVNLTIAVGTDDAALATGGIIALPMNVFILVVLILAL